MSDKGEEQELPAEDDGEEEVEGEEEEQNGEDDESQPPPRPEDEEEKELLFLIEFLVDTLELKPENMSLGSLDPCLLQGENCVCLTFMYYPPMSICEKEMNPCKVVGENVTKFNAGKSLMFALSESQFESPPPINLDVSVHKIMPHGYYPSKLIIGRARIDLSELFVKVFEKYDEKPDQLPLSKSIKDTYELMGDRNKPTGEIIIYVRLSCLGQNVVTEFQRGGDECAPVLFKSKESRKVYECLPKQTIEENQEDVCPTCPGWGKTIPKNICETGGGENFGCGGGGWGGGGRGGGWGGGGRAGGAGGGGCGGNGYNVEGEDDDESEYEEFGTEVHGHALTIKVKKSQKSKPSVHGSKSCVCDKTGGTGKSGNQISFQVPQDQSFCKNGKNKAKLYKINSSNNGKNEVVQIVPQSDESPDKDIFVLRIGKQGEAYGKGKLELELRTPKQKVDTPPRGPRMFDSSAQTDKEEAPKKKGKK